MKRSIKFKGLRIDNNKWIFGDFGRLVLGGNIHYYITPLDSKRVEIKIESLGQLLGLQDKNGLEIYEGDSYKKTDIYKPIGKASPFERETVFVITFDEGSFSSKVIKAKNTAKNYDGIGVYKIGEIYHLHRATEIEITGNIYEN